MYTSDINSAKKEGVLTASKDYRQRSFQYFIATAFCVIINFIYGLFGHGVHSSYMTYMFLIPLAATLLCLLFKHRCQLYYQTLSACVATFTIGCFINGVLEIAGTSSTYMIVYWIAGGILFIANIVVLVANIHKSFN